MNRFTNMTTASKIIIGATTSCGFIGFVIGTAIGFSHGLYEINSALYRDDKFRSKPMILRIGFVGASLIGLPVIGGIGGMIIGVTLPISIPILYYLGESQSDKLY